ncbi:MAG: hypothetical protein IKA51_02950 [Clostridia bacterium]|nr:hypothetical protein [Clostridia bacterium]
MKKIVSIAIVLALALSFAVIPGAAISAKWDTPTYYPTGGMADVYESKGNLFIDTFVQCMYDHGSVAFKEKVKIDGLEIVMQINDYDAAGYNQHGYASAISISGAPYTDHVSHTDSNNYLVTNMYGIGCEIEKTAAILFYPVADNTFKYYGGTNDTDAVWKFGYARQSEHPTITPYKSGNIIVKFVVNGDNIDIYVNGNHDEVASFPKANVLDADGKAYLAIAGYGFGGVGQTTMISHINGVKANDFAGEEGSYTLTDNDVYEEPAPSEPVVPSTPDSSVAIIDGNKGGCGNKA